MDQKPTKRLGEILIEDGVLSRESLEEALKHQKEQGGLVGQILIQLGYLSEDELVSVLARQLRLPYISLANYSVNMEAVKMVGEDLSRKNVMTAFDVDDERIYVAMSDPLNQNWREELKVKTPLKPQVFVATPSEIMGIFDLAFTRRVGSEPQQQKTAG